MEINRKVFRGNIIDYTYHNIEVKDIMYEIVNINNFMYAKEISTGCLFPMEYDSYYEKILSYPCKIGWEINYIDFSFKAWIIDNKPEVVYANWSGSLEEIMVNNQREIDKYKTNMSDDKINNIFRLMPLASFLDNKVYEDMKALKDTYLKEKTNNISNSFEYDENQVYESNIISALYKSPFIILYKIVRIGNYVYGKELKTGIILPLYCGNNNYKEVESTYYSKNNYFINHTDAIIEKDPIILDNMIDNYLNTFNQEKRLEKLRKDIKFKSDAISVSDKELTLSEERTSIKYEDTFSLRNIPMECTVVNERELQTIVGRETETKELVKATLIGDESVILIGDAGCGKTALVENLARLINDKNKPYLVNKFIVEVNTCSLISGTRYRGEFEEKLQKVIDFAVKNKGNVILFIDEIHTLYGLGRTNESKIDAINILKPYIERKDIQIIGATTKEEYNESITQDKAFSSRFTTIKVNNLPSQIKEEIIVNYIEELEQKYNIKLDDNIQKYNLAVELVKLAERQDIRYKINSIRILKRLIKATFTEAIYNEHDKVLTEDIITCLELTDELLVKEEYLNNIKNKLNIKTNSKILKLKV